MATLAFGTDADLQARLASPNPYIAATAGQMAAAIDQAPDTSILMTVYDNYYATKGECHDYISLSASFPRNQVEAAQFVLKGSDPLVPHVRKCRKTVVPVTIEVGNLLWSGRVDTAAYKLDDDGMRTCTVSCLGDFNYLNYMCVWVNFLTPIQYQGPLSHAVYVGPVCTVIETMAAEQAFRLQIGLWEAVDNALSLNPDFRAWFGTWLESNGDIFEMLTTPFYVVHHDPLFDASPWVECNARFDTVMTMIQQVTKTGGIDVKVKLWRPGDPQPDAYANLKVATYVMIVTDRSNVTGPTDSFMDGILKDVVDLEGSVFGDTFNAVLNSQDEYAPEGVNIAPALGVGFVVPWAILVDPGPGKKCPFSYELVDHHPRGFQLIIGGKSPKWLDDLMNATTEYLIDMLMIVSGLTGISDTILDGVFQDTLLAFQLIENFDRRNDLGPYGYPEAFRPTGAAPYNVDALFTFLTFMWDTRGYRSGQATFENNFPYAAGRDVFPGSLMSIIDSERMMHTDYVENVVITDDNQHRARVTVQIGDGKAEEAPIVKDQRLITGIQELVNILTMST